VTNSIFKACRGPLFLLFFPAHFSCRMFAPQFSRPLTRALSTTVLFASYGLVIFIHLDLLPLQCSMIMEAVLIFGFFSPEEELQCLKGRGSRSSAWHSVNLLIFNCLSGCELRLWKIHASFATSSKGPQHCSSLI